MNDSFSERQGILQSAFLDPKEMPAGLRNRIWNITKDYIDNGFHADGYDRNIIIGLLWDNFFKQNKDILRKYTDYR